MADVVSLVVSHLLRNEARTNDVTLAFSGARTHSNNTAEMSAMVEALSFLGPRDPVARDTHSCINNDSKHAASVCLRTCPACTCMPAVDVKRPTHSTCTATPGTWVMHVLILSLF